jgi:L-asparagine transporter-like permease
MSTAWIVVIAFIAFIALYFWSGKRAREKNAERVASGQLQSPLYKAAYALELVLLSFILCGGNVDENHTPILVFIFIVFPLIIVALRLLS